MHSRRHRSRCRAGSSIATWPPFRIACLRQTNSDAASSLSPKARRPRSLETLAPHVFKLLFGLLSCQARGTWLSFVRDEAGTFAHWHKAAIVLHVSGDVLTASAAADAGRPSEGGEPQYALEACEGECAPCEPTAGVAATPPDCSEPEKKWFGRRQLQSYASSPQQTWQTEWRGRVTCWFLGLPLPTQQQLGSCMGALGLHIGSRLDASLRASRALVGQPAASAFSGGKAVAERDCEWVSDEALLQLPAAPAFPLELESFRLPPIPRLLPLWQHLQSFLETPNHVSQSISSKEALAKEALGTREVSESSPGTSVALGAAVGGGFAAGVALVLGLACLRRRSAQPELPEVMHRSSSMSQ